MAAAGVDYCGPVKKGHKGFCLATLEKLMKDWPGGYCGSPAMHLPPITIDDRPPPA